MGYTWASNYFKNVFAVSAKVTNGLNADGSEILDNSTKNSKDVWADADYWFGPDGGVTVMMYRGSKDQIQNSGATEPVHLSADLLPRTASSAITCSSTSSICSGGYIRSQDDWQWTQGGTDAHYIANTYRGEADYYFKTGHGGHGALSTA